MHLCVKGINPFFALSQILMKCLISVMSQWLIKKRVNE